MKLHRGQVTSLAPAFPLPWVPNTDTKCHLSCHSAHVEETETFLNATDTTYIDFFFFFKPCIPLVLATKGHFFLSASKVKQRRAAKALRGMFLKTAGKTKGLEHIHLWAQRQAHLLTQGFASKGSYHHTDLSFEGASYCTCFCCYTLHADSCTHGGRMWSADVAGEEAIWMSDVFPPQQMLTISSKRKPSCLHSLYPPKKFHTGIWRNYMKDWDARDSPHSLSTGPRIMKHQTAQVPQ